MKQFNMIARFLTFFSVFTVLVMPFAGCKQLSGGQGSWLSGQPVSVSVKVSESLPPAAPPAVAPALSPSNSVPPPPPSTALEASLVPANEQVAKNLMFTDMSAASRATDSSRSAISRADIMLDGKTISEDLTLRGFVLVRGSLVVAPHATLRIEPGATVRFAPAAGSAAARPGLVVLGRLVVMGSPQKPVLLSGAFEQPSVGDWAGVVLLSTEKKNSLDHCRIEGAWTGLTARYSQFSGTALSFAVCMNGIALYDSVVSLVKAEAHRCDVGIRLSDSEMELKDSLIRENRLGIFVQHSALIASGSRFLKNSQEGILLDQSRYRISRCNFSENRSGMRSVGGEGQIQHSRFHQNRETGAVIQETRIRINNSFFSKNSTGGILIENSRGNMINSSLFENGSFQMRHVGTEQFSAQLNWWGTSDEQRLAAMFPGVGNALENGVLQLSPFLKSQPAKLP